MARNNKASIYGYFALEDFEYKDFNDKTNETKEFSFKEGQCFYIGIATTTVSERHTNHMKPSKYKGKDGQVINRVLQDNMDKWELVENLGEVELRFDMIIDFNEKLEDELKQKFEKEFVHQLEMELVKEFNPIVNIYGK